MSPPEHFRIFRPSPFFFRGSCDLDEFESAASEIGVSLEVTKLAPGETRINFGARLMGNFALASYEATRSIGMAWEARPSSINFSIRVGPVGMKMFGKQRAAYSIIVYLEPGVGSWAGVLDGRHGAGSAANPTYHVSLPIEAAMLLGLPRNRLGRGWFEHMIEPNVANAFAKWADRALAGSELEGDAQDELYGWLLRLLGDTLEEPKFLSPPQYQQLVHRVMVTSDANLREPISITSISQQLGVSVRSIQRGFRSTFGEDVSTYLRKRRLRAAKTLMEEGGLTMNRAATETGFRDPGRFSRYFREYFGYPPSHSNVGDR